MVFVVAEIGVNWNGDLDLAKKMITKSKESGCDAVKFQAFNEKNIQGHPEIEKLLSCAITKKNIKNIDKIARDIGIEWFCTPMYPDAVELLEPFVNRYKIRYADGKILQKNESSELIEKIFETKKQVIVSSQNNPNKSKYYNVPNIKWLYCVPKYPCDLEDVNFGEISSFNGYSNHCPEIIVPLTAAILGCEIIEVHVTMNKNEDFFDNSVSFDFEQVKFLVEKIRQFKKIKK